MTVNEYQPGDGIAAHIDTPWAFTDGLCSLSLGSDIIMEFKLPPSEQGTTDDRCKDDAEPCRQLLLTARSLLVLRGPARYEWTHAIHPRKSDTYVLGCVSMAGKTNSNTEEGEQSNLFDVARAVCSVPRQRRLSMTFRKLAPQAPHHLELQQQAQAQARERARKGSGKRSVAAAAGQRTILV